MIDGGFGRLATSFGDLWPDVTLGFCGGDEPQWLRLPAGCFCQLEALTPMNLQIHSVDDPDVREENAQAQASHPRAATRTQAAAGSEPGWDHRDSELISEWLLDLHLVRQPIGTETRLASLLHLLVERFGIRTAEGYRLPFPLGHARIAELIGATRSTVTRQFTLLRKQGLLQLDEASGTLLLTPDFIQARQPLRPR